MLKMNVLKDKVALVTGATSGIGREAAILFAKEGAKVVVAGRRKDEGEEVAALIRKAGGTAKFIQVDVSKSDQVERLVNETVSTFGTLNVAFNNAGIEGKFGVPLAEQTEAIFDEVIGINLKGAFLSLKYEAAVMPPGSSIVFNSSIVAEVGFAGAAVYASSKGGVNALAFSAALELAKAGIRVNVLSPGVTLTDMARRGLGDDQSIQNLAANIIPLARAGQPVETAQAALFLASDQSSYITGQVLRVDGGYTAQ
jgi:NAD(P)-dependent dehydrogenase (short-subunit alcohol dehydrogenase family)